MSKAIRLLPLLLASFMAGFRLLAVKRSAEVAFAQLSCVFERLSKAHYLARLPPVEAA
jgi:hypothetical protein